MRRSGMDEFESEVAASQMIPRWVMISLRLYDGGAFVDTVSSRLLLKIVL